MKAIKIFILLFFITIKGFTQFSEAENNLKKYWRYRERLKNFVVPGDFQGGSLVSNSRNYEADNDSDLVFGEPDESGNLNYGDQTTALGHYIGILATEYALLKKNGITGTALNNNLKEMYYALEAINRLDYFAEYWWRYYYKNDGPSANQYLIDFNGFFIRDDIPNNFGDLVTPQGLVENRLNESYFPPHSKTGYDYKANYFSSGFYEGTNETAQYFHGACINENGKTPGPREANLDQICQLMLGLALVSKCIPVLDNTTYTTHTFLDGLSNFALEAKAIAERIDIYARSVSWELKNPVTLRCVSGVFWDKTVSGDAGCKCNSGGADMQFFSYGFAKTNSYIQTGYSNTGLATAYYLASYSTDVIVDGISKAFFTIGLAFANDLNSATNSDHYKSYTYAATANTWINTGKKITNRLRINDNSDPPKNKFGDIWHTPLVNYVLFKDMPGNVDDFSEVRDLFPVYECMLNAAPCEGPVLWDQNQIWNRGNGPIFGGFNMLHLADPEASPSSDWGGSYLLYFNLYNLANVTYCPTYRYISPFELASDDLVKMNYIETDHRNFIAANSITAKAVTLPPPPEHTHPPDQGNPIKYIIENDNDPQPAQMAKADVNFMAGKEIHLEAGFEVHAGANFHASINPAVLPMNCNTISNTDLEACVNQIRQIHNQNAGRSYSQNNNEENTYQELLNYYQQLAENKKELPKQKTTEISTKIIPNPNSGVFSLQVENNSYAGISIIITDVFEKVIKQNNYDTSNGTFELDIQDQSKGIYFLKIVSGKTVLKTDKIIVK